MENKTLMTDLYELTMAQTYFDKNEQNKKVYFDVFFRKNPFNGGYAISGGLDNIIDYINNFKITEEDIDYEYLLEKSIKTEKRDLAGSLAYSVSGCALRLNCKAIFTPTISGYTAKKISRYHPICLIIAASPNLDTIKSLSLNFGIYPILLDDLKSLDAIIDKSKNIAQNVLNLKEKDNIIITGGYPFKKIKTTNFMKIEEL